MLSRPQLKQAILVYDATQDVKIEFNVSGGDQVVGHQLECINNTSGEIVHTHTTMSFLLSCNIDKNTLVNGKEYRIRIRTFNADINSDFSNINTNNASSWSDYCITKCFTQATVEVVNIPVDTTGNRLIKNQTFTFESMYYQKENVALKSYRYVLYDRDKVVMQVFPEVYQVEGTMKQEITGFISDKEYYIEIVTLNQYEIETRSSLIRFRVDYSPPRITQILQLTNDSENALIKVDAQVVQMLLQGEGNYKFENYSTYLRNRTISEVVNNTILDEEDKTLLGFTTERIVNKLGEYTENGYELYSQGETYSITTDPTTVQDVFFINLDTQGSKVWIDDGHGLNMDYLYTMHIWAESIVENKELLRISGKNSSLILFVSDGNVHCVETYMGVKRHTKAKISDYVTGRGVHIFLQKRDTYIRVISEAVIK